VDCEGTAAVNETTLSQAIRKIFPLSPQDIIAYLNLLRPIYVETAHDGAFGREGKNFTWERTDKVQALRKACGA
jgi:S-adenosylmethionine synthetase